jgi:hypothetical protein
MIVIGILACTTTPKFEFPQGTRVGIINLLESHATHKNISSFATENFTKTYQVGWDIPSYAENQLITLLEKDASFHRQLQPGWCKKGTEKRLTFNPFNLY